MTLTLAIRESASSAKRVDSPRRSASIAEDEGVDTPAWKATILAKRPIWVWS